VRKKMKAQVVLNSGNIETCPVCHGATWELYKIPSDFYDGQLVEYAKRCVECSGERRTMDFTGIPNEFSATDLSKFKFDAYSVDLSKLKTVAYHMLNHFGEWKSKEKGIYLWSKTPGSGKTFLACCMARSLMIKYDLQMRFISVPDYISLVGDSYNRERGTSDKSKVYRECDLLVFDDIGTQKSGEWQEQELFRVINERMTKGLTTIYTSNIPVEDLKVSERIKNRITKTAIAFQMPEESVRGKKAKKEQEDFIRSILE